MDLFLEFIAKVEILASKGRAEDICGWNANSVFEEISKRIDKVFIPTRMAQKD